jgi:methylamine utilization protein MauE
MQADTEIGRLGDTEQVSASPRRRVSVSALRWLSQLCRFGLAALFLFTAGAKLWILRDFVSKVAELLSSMGWNYQRWQWPVTVGVIGGEILIAALLIIPRTVRLGAAGAGLMLIGFSGFALYYVYGLHGEPLECGCFGNIIGSQLGLKTALRNLLLLIPAVIVFFGVRRAGASHPS